MAGDADAILDLRETVVESAWRHRLTGHQVELVAEVEERLAALGAEVLLPRLGLRDDRPRLVRLVAAN